MLHETVAAAQRAVVEAIERMIFVEHNILGIFWDI
jgi:hypothetical protein